MHPNEFDEPLPKRENVATLWWIFLTTEMARHPVPFGLGVSWQAWTHT